MSLRQFRGSYASAEKLDVRYASNTTTNVRMIAPPVFFMLVLVLAGERVEKDVRQNVAHGLVPLFWMGLQIVQGHVQ